MCRYKLVDIELQFVKKEKDLEVVVTSKFSWEPQVASLFNKATSRLGLLNRTYRTMHLMKYLVRVGSPCCVANTQQIVKLTGMH